MPGGEGGAIPAALGCKQEEVGACLVCDETETGLPFLCCNIMFVYTV